MNNIKIEINIDLLNVTDEETFEILNTISNKMRKKKGQMTFKELNKMFIIKEREYHPVTINSKNLNNDPDYTIHEIRILG